MPARPATAPAGARSASSGLRPAAARLAVVAVLALLLATVRIPGRPATLCTLRSVTGIPCPFCGGTTAMAELGTGDLAGAVAASPLALGLVAVGVLAPLGLASAWRQRSKPLQTATLGGALVAAELWQLARFGWLG